MPRALVARSALLVTACAVLASCERCAPDLVAEGVARLSVRSAAVVADLVEHDATCGFASAAAVVTIDGDAGGAGTVTTHVDGCTIDLGSDTKLAADCNGDAAHASGKIVVTATKTIAGHLTGDPAQPAVPAGANAVTIALEEVRATAFTVKDAKAAFTIVDGSFAATLAPLLFADAATGACAVPSRNAHVTVAYAPSTVHVDADGHSFDVDVATSSIDATAGVVGDVENALAGAITVFGGEQALSTALDPDYVADEFAATWTCTDGLAQPLSTSCGASDVLGPGAARLLLRTLGIATKLVEDDPACGFASADVTSRVDVVGDVGHDGAVATFGIARPCTIAFPDEIVVATDCNGAETRVQGSIEVTGTKTLAGYATGDAATPIVPTSRDAVHFDLVVDLTGFTVRVDGQPALTVQDGLLTGAVGVRTGQDASNGACSRPTPSATFEHVGFGGTLAIVGDDASVALDAALTDVSGQNGPGPTSENALAGTASVDGDDVALDGPLDPAYDAVDFQSGFICEQGLLIPIDDETCTFRPPLGQLTARLVLDLIDGALAAAPSDGPGGPFADDVVASDCTTETRASGAFTLTSARTSADGVDHVELTDLTFANFSASLGGTRVLTLTGRVRGAVDVAFALDGPTGVRDVPSPVRRYTAINLDGVDAQLSLDGLTFFYRVDASDLIGTRGTLDGVTNELTGTIRVDGQDVVIPVDRRDRTLDPEHDVDAFIARYACEPGYVEPVE